jgi:adenosylcobinamide-GDP ribazoletransferase
MSARPTLADAAYALRYLTIAPAPRNRGALGPATIFFPAVGLLLGAVVAGADALCAGFVPGLRAAIAVLLLALLARFEPPRSLWKLGAALAAGRDRAGVLQALRGSGSAGLGLGRLSAPLLAGTVVLAKLWALSGDVALRGWALSLAPMLGRWAMVVVAFSARQARPGEPGPRFDSAITFREFGWASVFAAGVCLVGLDAIGLLAVLAAVAVAVALRLLLHRWLGGVSETTLHASGELAETAVFLVFAALRSS